MTVCAIPSSYYMHTNLVAGKYKLFACFAVTWKLQYKRSLMMKIRLIKVPLKPMIFTHFSALLIYILHCITHSMPSHEISVGKYQKNIGCSIALNLFYVCHDATQSSAGAVKSNDSTFFFYRSSSSLALPVGEILLKKSLER